MNKFIKTFDVTGLGLVAVMDEWTGKELYEQLPYCDTEGSLFNFFSKDDALRLVDAFRNPDSEESLLKPPFSPDCIGSTGDCIVYKRDRKIFTLAVSLRNEVRISEDEEFSAYGGGKMFIKVRSKIDCKFSVEITTSDADSFAIQEFMRFLNL